MAKLAPSEITTHRAFLKRQEVYEARYYAPLYRYLNSIYTRAAAMIAESGVDAYRSQQSKMMQGLRLEAILRRLYKEILIKEAVLQSDVLPGQKMGHKDVIDDLSTPFGNGNTIKLWRGLIDGYINVRLTGRITDINATTERAISRIIEKAIADGLGSRETARLISKQTGFNKNRARAIARTETVTASNQGKYMAALTSPVVLEKNWVPTPGPRTRPTHAAMSDHPWIDIDALFWLDSLKRGIEPGRYPCDSTLSAENVINCRCSVVFRAKRDKTGNIIQRL